MAGGTFVSQNKVRPGVYINFKKKGTDYDVNADRGIVAVGLALDWGEIGQFINVSKEDMNSGKSLAKVGMMADDANAKILRLILANANIAKVYRLNVEGVNASKTIGNLTVTAKYSGTFGNKIAILISEVGNNYEVETYADGYLVDTQRVAVIADLVANDFVTFEGTGDLEATESSVLLTGGTTGTVTAATAYAAMFEALKYTKWNVIPVCNYESVVNPLIANQIAMYRNDEGKYVQAVVADYNSDYEGIINNLNGAVINGETISPVEFTAYVAGLTASATHTESNTGRVIEGATGIVGQLSNAQIIEALKSGKFVLSSRDDGQIKVEKDINSLHTFTAEKGYDFTKNKVIRVLDHIAASVKGLFENSFMGKVQNNDDGRDMFKSEIITLLSKMQEEGAIKEFQGAQDVDVAEGDQIDSVIAGINVKPVDAIEFVYLTINVGE